VRSNTSSEIRLAAQLHDGVGQVLSAALIRLEPLLKQGGAGGIAARLVSSLIEEAIEHTRSLTRDLCPPILYQQGIAPAMEWLANEMFRLRALRVELYEDSSIPDLHRDARAVLFSAVRELLVNVSKHAGVNTASVTLGTVGDRVYAIVKDAGVGFDPAPPRSDDTATGFGMFHIRHRVEQMGGSVTVRSRRGGGTEARVTLPSTELESVLD
jgi:signal transduction histidine kinase